ncbi:MAG: V-type ATPase subunit [Treponema sp.]|jgi:vacuolar-type H+-ATPase subunit C/Vma6|nr:V-type ATPase subunit [Treponema sp.]
MLNDGEYAYAKACGIIGKSFIGKRISFLSDIHNLSELDRAIFPDRHQELPGRELLADLEHRIVEHTVRQILGIVSSYTDPPELLIRMLRVYEYTALKACLQNISAGKKNIPPIYDIGRFATVRFDSFPDITAMLKKTEFSFLLSEELKSFQPGTTDITPVETKLDSIYYVGLTESLWHLSGEDRRIAQRILIDEISLRNCVWALRLRTYYEKTAPETRRYLMDVAIPENRRMRTRHPKGASLASEAFASLELPLDSRLPWKGWKWEKFLNPEETGVRWKANPRYFQNAASRYLYRLTLRSFHRSPLAVSAVFCFIKLKQFEEDILTSIAEGLALGVDSSSVFKMLEVW